MVETTQESSGWIMVLIILLIFIAIWLLAGKWIVEYVVKNLPWKVFARCTSEHC